MPVQEFAIGDRYCTRCGHVGPLEDYFRDSRYLFGRKNLCRFCRDNQQKHRQRKLREKKRAVITAAKDKPCADCGVLYPPEVMDLDHVRGEKLGGVGGNALGQNWPIERIVAEIAKCEVVCANCHRLRTHARRTAKYASPGV